jgi:hypothetical protein
MSMEFRRYGILPEFFPSDFRTFVGVVIKFTEFLGNPKREVWRNSEFSVISGTCKFDLYNNDTSLLMSIFTSMSMSPCPYVSNVSVSPCLHVYMSPCPYVSMSLCFHVSLSSCLHVSLSPCLNVSMSPCIYVFMSPCLHVHVFMSMSPCPRQCPCLHVYYVSIPMSPYPCLHVHI